MKKIDIIIVDDHLLFSQALNGLVSNYEEFNVIKVLNNGKELIDLKWFNFPDAKKIITETNHPEKAELLLESLDFCLRDICGGMSPKERRAAMKSSV